MKTIKIVLKITVIGFFFLMASQSYAQCTCPPNAPGIECPTFYRDKDGDGKGNPSVTMDCIERPSGYVSNNDDCDDNNASVWNTCGSSGCTKKTWYVDNDGDGFGANSSSSYHQGLPSGELGIISIRSCTKPEGSINYVTNRTDCNDLVSGTRMKTFYRDADGDTYGVSSNSLTACDNPGGGWVTRGGDCNDDPDNDGFLINPGTIWYPDVDKDGYPGAGTQTCVKPSANHYLARDLIQPIIGDCNDRDPKQKPGAVWYRDLDGDGYSSGYQLAQCSRPDDYYTASELKSTTGDCNDKPAELGFYINPETIWYADYDGDKYPASDLTLGCPKPSEHHYLAFQLESTVEIDCDDTDKDEKPGAVWYKDFDRDYYGNGDYLIQCLRPAHHYTIAELGQTFGDCDDTDKDEKPGAVWYKDKDGDKYSDGTIAAQCERPPNFYLASELINISDDCNDDDPAKKPGAKWYADYDGDGLGDSSISFDGCEPLLNFVSNNSDGCPTRFGTNNGCPVPGINYIKTRSPRIMGVTSVDVAARPHQEVNLSTSYFNGLGSTSQQVIRANSPEEYDVIVPVAYDELGRVDKEYLPFASPKRDGDFLENALTKDYQNSEHYNFYQTEVDIDNDTAPFSHKRFERSPLSRVLEQAAPGSDWQLGDKSVVFHYLLNDGDDVIDFDWNQFLVQVKDHYLPNKLTRNEVVDEDEKISIEYRNKLGQLLLKESNVDANTWAKTYYIYDDLGHLRVVLPPEAVKNLSSRFFGKPPVSRQSFLDTWAFQYKYDRRRRMVEKKVPGSEKTLLVYDKRDRLVLTQDGNQRDPLIGGGVEWLFTKYDGLNRPIITGIMNDSPTIINDVSNQSTSEKFHGDGSRTHQYTDGAYPSETSGLIKEYLTITYYDTHDFTIEGELDAWYVRPPVLNEQDAFHIRPLYSGAKGQVTGSMTRMIGTTDFLTTISFYDDRYRVIQVVSENHLGGTDVISNQYDFTGNVRRTHSVHGNGFENTTILVEYEYDHANRLTNAFHKLDSGPRVHLFSNEYNELGQLIRKKLHGSIDDSSFAQSIDYEYNIRGWLKSINKSGLSSPGPDDLFSLELIYNTTVPGLPNN